MTGTTHLSGLSSETAKQYYVAGIPLDFAPHIGLPDAQKAVVANWKTLQDQVAERRKRFNMTKVVVKGVSIIGGGTRVLNGIFQLCFELNDMAMGYHPMVIADSASLVRVFRVAGKQTTGRTSPDKHYVELVRQPRIAHGCTDSLEVANGLREDHETRLAAAKRERVEETGDKLSKGAGRVKQLGKPFTTDDGITGAQYLYWVVENISAKELAKKRKEFPVGGVAAEGEATVREIWPLEQAYKQAIRQERGHAVTMIALGRIKEKLAL